MKNYFILFLSGLLLSGCASISPVGSWDYSVTGTPQGDYTGTMTVTKKNKEYGAVLNSQGSDLVFKKFSFDAKTKKTSGDFDFQSTPIYFDAEVKKNEMTGHMSTDDAQFPFKATRKVSK
jgi:uncharacterized protein YceK